MSGCDGQPVLHRPQRCRRSAATRISLAEVETPQEGKGQKETLAPCKRVTLKDAANEFSNEMFESVREN